MRYAILATLAVALSGPIFAQQPEFPAGAQALEARLLIKVGPQTRAWIKQEAARQLSTGTVSQSTATRAVAANRGLGNLGTADIDALAFLVMMEASKSAQEDLKPIMDGVKRAASEAEPLRLQKAMDQKGQLDSTIASLMKKVSGTNRALTRNLK